jgi:hypothetical protein
MMISQLRQPKFHLATLIAITLAVFAGSEHARGDCVQPHGSGTWLQDPPCGNCTNNWNNCDNWTTETVPNGAGDVATFSSSFVTVITGYSTTVDSVIFDSSASSFSIGPFFAGWQIVGAGVFNNSGATQHIGEVAFHNSAIASGGGGPVVYDGAGSVYFGASFFDTSTAGNAFFPNGEVEFWNSSSADNGTFIMNGTGVSFTDSSTAGNGSFTCNSGNSGGEILFGATSNAGHGTFVINGATVAGHGGSHLNFTGTSSAANATLIANGGITDADAGYIDFGNFSPGPTGGIARVEVFGNGYLSINTTELTIGSVEGTGKVVIGSNTPSGNTLTVGSNNLSTTFSGVIRGSGIYNVGLLEKIGSGVLTLEGRETNDYIADNVGLILGSGSIISLNFTGDPDVIRSLVVDGAPQPPGVYGSATSGAPHPLPEFSGPGTVQVTSGPTPTPTPTASPTPTPTPTHPPFFNGETPLGGGWYYLQFPNGTPFGYYAYLTDQRFIYHFDMGYEYWFDANDGQSGIFFYDFASNHFFYTSPSFPFPYLYDFSLNTVLYYYPDPNNPGHYTTNPRYFYDFATGQIITM